MLPTEQIKAEIRTRKQQRKNEARAQKHYARERAAKLARERAAMTAPLITLKGA